MTNQQNNLENIQRLRGKVFISARSIKGQNGFYLGNEENIIGRQKECLKIF